MRRPQSNELRPQTAFMRRFQPILSLAWLAQLHAFVPVCPVRFKVYNRALPAIHDGTRNTWSDLTSETNGVDEDVTLESSLTLDSGSSLFDSRLRWNALLESIQSTTRSNLLWEQAKEEAQHALTVEPDAGAQLYQGILFHKSLLEAIVTNISHEIETELMPATAIKNLFLEALTPDDEKAIERDIMAVAMRSPSAGNIMTTILFHKGFHALVCYRVGHRLWEAGRSGLAYYMQSTVSRKFSADIHPAAVIGPGTYLSTGGGVVIGETAVVGQDTSILQGVTLGGTGKENGDRHPKIGNGVILHPGATVLGNISVGDGSVVAPKSIVTKPVPFLARVSGVPARIVSYRDLTEEEFNGSDLCRHLGFKYMDEWRKIAMESQDI